MAATTLVHAEPLPDLPDPPATLGGGSYQGWFFIRGWRGEGRGGRVCRWLSTQLPH